MSGVKAEWPGWETVRLIGVGSFGAVYEIQRDSFGIVEKAALKVITIPRDDHEIEGMRDEGYDDESITRTFHNYLQDIIAEYNLTRSMNGSANIVHCDDIRYVKHDDGIGWDIFIKMELLTPLPKALPEQVPEDMVIQIGIDLCKALELCKNHNIIHRDVKPQNIFRSDDGTYKLGDFGIAKTIERTTGGTIIGTYKYMAPEVYNHSPYGTSADLYSLGLVLYWLLNERRMPFLPLPPAPIKSRADEEAREKRFSGAPIPPPVHGSGWLQNIVLKACAFDPKSRFSTPTEMREALEQRSAGSVTIPVPQPEPENQTVHIVFRDSDGRVLTEQACPAGTSFAVPRVADREEREHIHHFTGWEPQVDTTVAEKDIIYTAKYTAQPRRKKPRISLSHIIAASVAVVLLCAGVVGFRLMSQRTELPAEESNKKIWWLADEARTMAVGDMIVLKLLAEDLDDLPEKKEWSSSDERILSVNKVTGKIKANAVGTATISLVGDGQEKTCTITVVEATNSQTNSVPVVERKIQRVELLQAAKKDTYYVGDQLDTMGVTLSVVFNDDTTEEITTGFTADYDFSRAGTSNVQVTYEGHSVSFPVQVLESTLHAITIASLPNNTVLTEQTTLDTTGLKLRLIYSNGEEKTVSSGFTCSPTTFTSVGQNTVCVSYEGKTTEFNVTVQAKTITGLEAKYSGKPYIGDSFDGTKLSVTAYYDNGTSQSVSSEMCEIIYDFRTAGEGRICVTYDHFLTYAEVYVETPEIKLWSGATGAESMILTASTTPAGQKITWSSSNPSVITVNSKGVATAVSSGNATITAEFTYGGETYSSSQRLSTQKHEEVWNEEQSTNSKPTESSSLKITRMTQTEWGYYHYDSHYNGQENVDSCWVNNSSKRCEIRVSSPLEAKWICGDQGGRADEEYSGPNCTRYANGTGHVVWWRDTALDTYVYYYKTLKSAAWYAFS